MIAKISVPRGVRAEPLIYYLFGPGRREEHTDPHLIAGWRHPAELEPPLRPDGSRDFRPLLGLLKQPHAALGERGYARPVWHCAVRAAPQDKMLSDDEWAQIACDVMDRTGLAPCGQEDDAVRWVAVRHGADHIHIVAMLARQDGGKPRLSCERYRVRAACLAAESRYQLRSTSRADRTAPRGPSRGETEKAARRGLAEPPRITLRRHVITAAAASGGQEEFFTRLHAAGILARKRYSTTTPGQVTGYAVALPGDTSPRGEPVWYGGGKLAADLTWPKLTRRWTSPGTAPARQERWTAAERHAIWEHAAQAAAEAAAHIRADPATAADAAWAASGTLHAAAAALRSRALRQAADTFDRAARAPYGRVPRPTPAGNQLRQTARLISACAHLTRDPALATVTLITRLAVLAEAVAELRATQHRAAQATAARTAARQLNARIRSRPAPVTTASRLAAQSFPPSPWSPAWQPPPERQRAGRDRIKSPARHSARRY
ncbi:MAG TPA: hypothetical protein VNF47_18615 [Streptosporangiaceae bacterium]|nr:hypothetical protein [Streptosporangiaceae bacterium]